MFELDRIPKGSSVSIRTILEQVYRTTGKMPAKLADEPELLSELDYLWSWFIDLYHGEIISWQELNAWVQLSNESPTFWDLNLVRRLSINYTSWMNEG